MQRQLIRCPAGNPNVQDTGQDFRQQKSQSWQQLRKHLTSISSGGRELGKNGGRRPVNWDWKVGENSTSSGRTMPKPPDVVVVATVELAIVPSRVSSSAEIKITISYYQYRC